MLAAGIACRRYLSRDLKASEGDQHMLSSNNAAADINNNNALPSNIAAPIKSMAQRILVADDYEHIRQALHDVLAVSFPECDIVAASTAEEAVRLAKLHAPAVVIMDLRIP